MSAIDNLVRKLKKAVTGIEEPVSAGAQPFHWEPAAVAPAPGPRSLETPSPREPPAPATPAAEPVAAAPPVSGPSGVAPKPRRPPGEAASVVGAEIPADVSDFATVYKGAGVEQPSHGYGVDRVAEMLEHRSLAGLDKSVKANAVLAALDAAGVHIQDVIHDGLLRYKALVAFEAAKELEFHAVRPRNEHRVEQLRLAIATFQQKKSAELEVLTHEATAAVAALSRLKSRQRAEEERFQRAISLFVEPLPARVLPMTPRAEAAAAEAPEPKPELKLVFATPPSALETGPSPAAEAATPASDEPMPGSEEALPESERPTVRLTPEQMSLIAAADFAAQTSESPEESEPKAPPRVAPLSPKATLRLTAEQSAAIVAGFKDVAAELAASEARPESELPAPESDARKDPTIRLTPEQAAAIVSSSGGESAQDPGAAAGGEAGIPPTDPATLKDRAIRLTHEQTRAILASFAAAGKSGGAAGAGGAGTEQAKDAGEQAGDPPGGEG